MNVKRDNVNQVCIRNCDSSSPTASQLEQMGEFADPIMFGLCWHLRWHNWPNRLSNLQFTQASFVIESFLFRFHPPTWYCSCGWSPQVQAKCRSMAFTRFCQRWQNLILVAGGSPSRLFYNHMRILSWIDNNHEVVKFICVLTNRLGLHGWVIRVCAGIKATKFNITFCKII